MAKYREMMFADIPAIVRIEQENFSLPWTAESFKRELQENMFAKYTVVEEKREILAYGGIWLILDEAHVTNIAVKKRHQGKKIGQDLIQYMMREAFSLGAQRMTLEVRVSNQVAQLLYKKMGFFSVGIRPKYYSDNLEDALIMWKNLTFEKEE